MTLTADDRLLRLELDRDASGDIRPMGKTDWSAIATKTFGNLGELTSTPFIDKYGKPVSGDANSNAICDGTLYVRHAYKPGLLKIFNHDGPWTKTAIKTDLPPVYLAGHLFALRQNGDLLVSRIKSPTDVSQPSVLGKGFASAPSAAEIVRSDGNRVAMIFAVTNLGQLNFREKNLPDGKWGDWITFGDMEDAAEVQAVSVVEATGFLGTGDGRAQLFLVVRKTDGTVATNRRSYDANWGRWHSMKGPKIRDGFVAAAVSAK